MDIDSKEFKNKLKEILELNELYLKYLYIHTFEDVEVEKQRLRSKFKIK